jgi:hypothetical protein
MPGRHYGKQIVLKFNFQIGLRSGLSFSRGLFAAVFCLGVLSLAPCEAAGAAPRDSLDGGVAAKDLISHLRRVIPDEINHVPPKMLLEFVKKYQIPLAKAGVDDLDRQTQYMLLALYTSGRGVEHPACVEFMKHAPKTLDDFYTKIQALPQPVWDAGQPLWDTKKF